MTHHPKATDESVVIVTDNIAIMPQESAPMLARTLYPFLASERNNQK